MRDVGAFWTTPNQCRFRVWAPCARRIDLHLISPDDCIVPMQKHRDGYFETTIDRGAAELQYWYRLDGEKDVADPASMLQPEGVHGPSQLCRIDGLFQDHQWHGIPIENYIIYELHVGTFTKAGTFEAAISELDRLIELGITAIEIMPVSQFPGGRNWGYDGVFPYAVQNTYGGPEGLAKLVDACHQRGLAVILDVVYNHLGPEGNYLPLYGQYFTDQYKTPWGPAINFDGENSDEVRHYFVQNALYWITEFHIDALRLDAVHAILDHSAIHILEEITEAVHCRGTELNRRVYVIGESDLNDTRLIRSTELGGYNLDAQWNDDFHHALHTLLTKENRGYYADFGTFQHMAQAFSEGFVYTGHYSVSRKRRHGNSSRGVPPFKFVVYAKNHDQIGNRMRGERLSQLVSFEFQKLAVGVVLLSPFLPLIFMGDEYGETAPFQYFISHLDPALADAVREGRKREFADFKWAGEPPDPQAEETFQRSHIHPERRHNGPHRELHEFTRELIRLRKTVPELALLSKEAMDVLTMERELAIIVRRWKNRREVLTAFNFNPNPVQIRCNVGEERWTKVFDSDDEAWLGRGANTFRVRTGGELEFQLKSGAILLIRNVPL